MSAVLCRPAVRILQDRDHPVYQFSLTAGEILQVADISRVSRDTSGALAGYQRPESRRHVDDICEYLNGEEVIFPNSLILALTTAVRFRPYGRQTRDSSPQLGILEIRIPRRFDPKPAWIVDGQQRALALSKSSRSDLWIPVNGFLANEIEVQRDQFIRINNTKPLPRGLIDELLPTTVARLPREYEIRRIPAMVCSALNCRTDSPFYALIASNARCSPAMVAHTSIIQMVRDSLCSPTGCLFSYRNVATGEVQFEDLMQVLITYWTAVRNLFPDAWAKPPGQSRLMHGAGIRAMGRLMDKVMSCIDAKNNDAIRDVEELLAPLVSECRWTSGIWESLGNLPWNEIQNTPRHARLLSDVVVSIFQARKRVVT
jgi:DGQHR domain-containing protein